jgi:thiamine-phosphate pyrophosphorylase
VLAAAREGASFVTLSPVFAVPDKGSPLGVAAFAAIARASEVPLFALGGIDAARAGELARAGAHGVAVIREVWDKPRPAAALADLIAAIDAANSTPR